MIHFGAMKIIRRYSLTVKFGLARQLLALQYDNFWHIFWWNRKDHHVARLAEEVAVPIAVVEAQFCRIAVVLSKIYKRCPIHEEELYLSETHVVGFRAAIASVTEHHVVWAGSIARHWLSLWAQINSLNGSSVDCIGLNLNSHSWHELSMDCIIFSPGSPRCTLG